MHAANDEEIIGEEGNENKTGKYVPMRRKQIPCPFICAGQKGKTFLDTHTPQSGNHKQVKLAWGPATAYTLVRLAEFF